MAPWLVVAVAGGLVLAAVAWGEYAHFRMARVGLGVAQPTAPQSEAVIVLGYRNRRPDRANARTDGGCERLSGPPTSAWRVAIWSSAARPGTRLPHPRPR